MESKTPTQLLEQARALLYPSNDFKLIDAIVKEFQTGDLTQTTSFLQSLELDLLSDVQAFIKFLAQLHEKSPTMKAMQKAMDRCNHQQPDGKPMKYHLENLLSRHAVACALLTMIYGSTQKLEPFVCLIIGYFHDCGKPDCHSLVPQTNVVSFKGHAWVGAVNFNKIMSEAKILLTSQVYLITHVIDMHMAGLHRTDSHHEHAQAIWRTHSCCSREFGEYLTALSYGDVCGSICEKEDMSKFYQSREVMRKCVCAEQSLLNAYGSYCKFFTKGVVIFMKGNSGTAKSSFSEKISQILPGKVVIVERDQCMIEKMIQVYFSGRKPEEFQTGKGYKEIYTKYSADKKTNASLVNQHLGKKVRDGLMAGKIIIIDTMAVGTKGLIPMLPWDLVSQCFRIEICCVPPNEITKELAGRRGMTPDEFTRQFWRGKLTPIAPHLDKVDSIFQEANLDTSDSDRFPKHFFEMMHMRFTLNWGFGMSDQFVTILKQLPDFVKGVASTTLAEKKDKAFYSPFSLNDWLMPLYHDFRGDVDAMREYLHSFGYLFVRTSITDGPSPFYLTSYEEYMLDWTTPYCHATRGTCMFYDEKEKKLCYVKGGPPKSPEINSKTGKESKVETQEENAHFSKPHQLAQKFVLGEYKTDAYYSCKRDGMLFMITVVPKKSPSWSVIDAYLQNHKTTFAFSLWQSCGDLEYGLVLSSQNTLFIDLEMVLVWCLSSMIYALRSEPKTIPTVKEIQPFLDKVIKMHYLLSLSHKEMGTTNSTYAFEAICPNRLTPVTGYVHKELAISYSTGSCSLLGVKIGLGYENSGTFIPHVFLQKELLESGLDDPLFWHVKTPEELAILQSGELAKMPKPSNLVCDMKNYEFDPEGALLYVNVDGESISCKLKNHVYYIFHKFEKYGRTACPGYKNWFEFACKTKGWMRERYPIIARVQQIIDNYESKGPELVQLLREDCAQFLEKNAVVKNEAKKEIKGNSRIPFYLLGQGKELLKTKLDPSVRDNEKFIAQLMNNILKNQRWFIDLDLPVVFKLQSMESVMELLE